MKEEENRKKNWMSDDARPVSRLSYSRGRGSSDAAREWQEAVEESDEPFIETDNPCVVIDKEFINQIHERGRPALDGDYKYTRAHLRDLGGCVRQIYFKMKGYADERIGKQFDWKDVFAMGKAVEGAFIEFVQLAGMDRGSFRIRHETRPVAGEVDRSIEYDGCLVCLEIKSADEWQFRKLVGELLKGKVKDSYYYQIQAYLLFQPKYKWAQLVIINRNSGFRQRLPTYVSARIYPDEGTQSKINDKLDALEKALKDGRPPPDPGYKAVFSEDLWVNGDWQCNPSYCPYTSQCWFGEGDMSPK